MAAGIPIIAAMSDRSEIARIIHEENCGVLVKPNEKQILAESILGLYNDKDMLRQKGRNASKAVAEKYNLTKIAREYFDLIKQVNADH